MEDADSSGEMVLIRMSESDMKIRKEMEDNESSGDGSRDSGKIKSEAAERQKRGKTTGTKKETVW